MKKNLYYRSVFQRENLLKKAILDFFLSASSYFRLLLEVFIRKDFGERYFKLSSAITVTALLAIYPLIASFLSSFFVVFTHSYGRLNREIHSDLFPDYLAWYAYLVLFVIVSIRHHRALKRNPSTFDFAKFSKYTGKINPIFYRFNFPDRKTDMRRVECLIEPAAFFIVGLLFYLIGQTLGGLLMVSSLFYGFSYVAAYAIGDNFVMDKIDEMIANEELEKSFVDDMDEDQTRGFQFRGLKPNGKDRRLKILPRMGADEEILEAK